MRICRDFGITKQLGADAADGAQAAGTLDYLAPEQIRGEPVDGHTDGYALACVLYECLAGTPPFRRQTQAETLWAHLQEEPPPLEAYPALDPVLRQALAQEQHERYATCSAVVEAARDAFEPPLRRSPVVIACCWPPDSWRSPARSPARSSRRRRARKARPPPRRRPATASPSIGPAADRLAAFVTTRGRAEQHRRRRERGLGPEYGGHYASRASIRRPRPSPERSRPRACRRISPPAQERCGSGPAAGGRQLDTDRPASRSAHGRGHGLGALPDAVQGGPVDLNGGFPQIAVGAGAVWATGGGPVARIDARTGARRRDGQGLRQQDRGGSRGCVVHRRAGCRRGDRIDPRTNRAGKPLRVGDATLTGIAVGGGSVWVTSEQAGVLWRIAPDGRTAARRSSSASGRRTSRTAPARSGSPITSTARCPASTRARTRSRPGCRSARCRRWPPAPARPGSARRAPRARAPCRPSRAATSSRAGASRTC